jgi:hypothetical protein
MTVAPCVPAMARTTTVRVTCARRRVTPCANFMSSIVASVVSTTQSFIILFCSNNCKLFGLTLLGSKLKISTNIACIYLNNCIFFHETSFETAITGYSSSVHCTCLLFME